MPIETNDIKIRTGVVLGYSTQSTIRDLIAGLEDKDTKEIDRKSLRNAIEFVLKLRGFGDTDKIDDKKVLEILRNIDPEIKIEDLKKE